MSLSGGEKQRVAIATALASDREYIVMDEPTSGLDYKHMKEVALCLKQLKELGKSVFVITHDVEQAICLSGRVLVVAMTPIRRLTSIQVPAGYPRTRACLSQPDMIALREMLIDLLRKRGTA